MSTRAFSMPNVAGSLLLAHPDLLEENFRRSVVLISAHSEEDGALGVVLKFSNPNAKASCSCGESFSL